jgi:hypothetical protein
LLPGHRPYCGQVLNTQWQWCIQVVGLHVKVIAQGSHWNPQSLSKASQSQVGGGQLPEHGWETLSQVTCPTSPTEQLKSTAEQLAALTLLLQLMVPPPAQFAVAVQRDFP